MLFCLTSEKCSDEESTFILSLDREHSGISKENRKTESGFKRQSIDIAERNEDRVGRRWLPSSAPSLHVELREEFTDIRGTSLMSNMKGKAATGSACYSG